MALVILNDDELQRANTNLRTAAKALFDNAGGAPTTAVQKAGFLHNINTIDGQLDALLNQHGEHKGPVQTARNSSTYWLKRAIQCEYDVGNASVLGMLVTFLLVLATNSLEGKDTSGTQMSNFRGEWPGGAFFK